MANELTPKQEKFCQEFVRTGNASEAYRLAYNAAKMKPEVIHVKASELLSSGMVSVRVKSIRESVTAKSELNTADILNEIRRLCAADPRRLVHEDGRPKLLHELDDDTAAAISSVEVGVDGIKYKLWDKNAALEKAVKITGLYEKDNKQKADPINALAAVVLGGIVGVSLQDDEPEDEPEDDE